MVNNLTVKIIGERLSIVHQAASTNIEPLVAFVELLAKWNRKINLTSLSLDPLTDDAIDRLIVEPVMASRLVQVADVRVVDLGSGGGSPGIPFRSQLPASSMRMVESRSRKCAFLREAVRTIGLSNTVVEESRFELLTSRSDLRGSADLITLRAVRIDESLSDLIRFLVVPHGHVFRFAAHGDRSFPRAFEMVSEHELTSSGSALQVLTLG